MTTKYTQWPENTPIGYNLGRPNGNKMYQHLPMQDPPKFTQIGIFGLKRCPLATLVWRQLSPVFRHILEPTEKFAPSAVCALGVDRHEL
jgi:hypothetical protein